MRCDICEAFVFSGSWCGQCQTEFAEGTTAFIDKAHKLIQSAQWKVEDAKKVGRDPTPAERLLALRQELLDEGRKNARRWKAVQEAGFFQRIPQQNARYAEVTDYLNTYERSVQQVKEAVEKAERSRRVPKGVEAPKATVSSPPKSVKPAPQAAPSPLHPIEQGKQFELFAKRLARREFPEAEGWTLLHNKGIPDDLRDLRKPSPGRPDWLAVNIGRARVGIIEVKDVEKLSMKHLQQINEYKAVLNRQSIRYLVISNKTYVSPEVEHAADISGVAIKRCTLKYS